MQPSQFRVSTITATGTVSTKIDLDTFFHFMEIRPTGPGFIFASHSCAHSKLPAAAVVKESADAVASEEPEEEGPQVRGAVAHRSRARRRRRKARPFENQTTVIYSVDATQSSLMNMKVFRNGNVQITGIKFPQQGSMAIDYLVTCLAIISMAHPEVVEDRAALRNQNYQVCLVNSDFSLGLEVRRNVLFDGLCALGMRCSFEPCIYPGVKVQYFWNNEGSDRNRQRDGICRCAQLGGGAPCAGKGKGQGLGDCRKVTIAVFQSGCVIITGAHTVQQVQDAYDFIVGYVGERLQSLQRPAVHGQPSTRPAALESDHDQDQDRTGQDSLKGFCR